MSIHTYICKLFSYVGSEEKAFLLHMTCFWALTGAISTKMIWRPDGWNCPKTRQILIDFSILSWKPVSGALQVSALESESLLSSELDLMLTLTLILLNSKAIFPSHSTSSTDYTWTLGGRCNVCFAGSLLCTKTASAGGESFSCAK